VYIYIDSRRHPCLELVMCSDCKCCASLLALLPACVCVCVNMCKCMIVYASIINIYIYIYIYISMYTYMNQYKYRCENVAHFSELCLLPACVCVLVCASINKYVNICMYVYIYTCRHFSQLCFLRVCVCVCVCWYVRV